MSFEEEIIDLPAMAVEGGPGLAIDISGSLIKVLYRSKEGYNDGETTSEKQKGNLGQLRMITCNHDNLNNILEYAIQKGDINSGSKAEIPITTCDGGGGYNTIATWLQNKLGLKVKYISEFKGLVNSLRYLSDHQPLDEFILPKPDDAIKESEVMIEFMQLLKLLFTPKAEIPKKFKIQTKENKNTNLYPCIIMSVESEASVLKVTEDGVFQLADTFNGGRNFVVMSRALTGVADFVELMDMAVRGNTGIKSTTDKYYVDMKNPDEEDLYNRLPDDFMLFAFDKCVTHPLEGIKKDDLVFSCLDILCADLALIAFLTALTHKVERVFFCGSFVSHPLVHKLLIKHMNTKVQTGPLDEEPILNFHMLRHTSHLSAIGAYLNDIVTMETTDQHKE